MKRQDQQDQRDLLNLVTGELPPASARALQLRLEQEPELAAAYRRLEATWSGLELRPPVGAPVGFAGRVATRAAELPPSGSATGLALGLRWLPAAAALVVGIGIGVELGDRLLTEPPVQAAAVQPVIVAPPAAPEVITPVPVPAVGTPRPAPTPVPTRPEAPAVPVKAVEAGEIADYEGLFATEGLGDAYWQTFGEGEGEGAPR